MLGAAIANHTSRQPVNHALNILKGGYPAPSASVNSITDSIYQAIDGRIWYFPEISNRWSTIGSTSPDDWLALDFGQPVELSTAKIYLYADGKVFDVPDSLNIEYQKGDEWFPVMVRQRSPARLVGNTVNTLSFEKLTTSRIRINFKHPSSQIALVEIEYY